MCDQMRLHFDLDASIGLHRWESDKGIVRQDSDSESRISGRMMMHHCLLLDLVVGCMGGRGGGIV